MNKMTFGEMRAWTSRYNNILEVGGSQTQIRLLALKRDLEMATDYKNDPPAASLHLAVQENMWEVV